MYKKIFIGVLGLLLLIGGVFLTNNLMNKNTNVNNSSKPIYQGDPKSIPSDKQISQDQVRVNSTLESCWTVIKGKVYNVTDFGQKHPGGSKEMSKACGKDVTNMFSNHPKSFSSPDQQLMDTLTEFYIGDLKQ
ncbi:MAG: cytochrome b5 domain-containing protein [Patescibacteria group bacterium]